MSQIYLSQLGFTYSACEPFTINKEQIQKSRGTGNERYICQNEVDKASSNMTCLMET